MNTQAGTISNKGLRKIGRGQFSDVWELDAEHVLIRSSDFVKEALAIFPPNHRNLPKCERIQYGEKSWYKMPKYQRLRNLGQLKPNDLATVRELRRIAAEHAKTPNDERLGVVYHRLQELLESSNLEATLREALVDFVGDLANYTTLIGLEVPRRNLAIDGTGDLILLDIFFDREWHAKALKKKGLTK